MDTFWVAPAVPTMTGLAESVSGAAKLEITGAATGADEAPVPPPADDVAVLKVMVPPA